MEKDTKTKEPEKTSVDVLGIDLIRAQKVLDVIKHLKIDTFLGPDWIYPRRLWVVRDKIAAALGEMYVSLLTRGEIQEDQRVAFI